MQFRGNTPADAGNSDGHRGSIHWSEKHPRRCGELARSASRMRTPVETPPQMRGTRAHGNGENLIRRNTPADAGNSSVIDLKVSIFWKHPRRCGELRRGRYMSGYRLETPPQMRGTPRLQKGVEKGLRNTPADAGNSRPSRGHRSRRKKHPRRCGELKIKSQIKSGPTETPPQMRGTPCGVRDFGRKRGNTPADAGNSFRGLTPCESARKHPRRCGELLAAVTSFALLAETPPQMRGTLSRLTRRRGD